MNFVGHAQQNARCAEQHGHMAVVAARMHNALVFRRIRSARKLGYGQRINVASQGDATARVPFRVIGVGRRALNGRDNAVFGNASVFNAHGSKAPAKGIRRLGLFQRQLGMLMEIAALGNEFFLHARRALLDFLDDFQSRKISLLLFGLSSARHVAYLLSPLPAFYVFLGQP